MNRLDKEDEILPISKEIGHLKIQYKDYDKAENVFPIFQENGKMYLLTNINACGDDCRLVLLGLKGKNIKNLMFFGHEYAETTVDDEKIYVFTSNTEIPMYYRFDKKTLELEYEKRLEGTRIQSACSNGEILCVFDRNNGELQRRDKNGNIIDRTDIRRPGLEIGHTRVFQSHQKFYFARLEESAWDYEIKQRYEEKYGKELVKNNFWLRDFAYDESTQTTFKATSNVIYVNSPKGMEGILYYPDNNIYRIAFNQQINSLIISTYNFSNENIGTLEIIPMSQMFYRMIESEKNWTGENKPILPPIQEYKVLEEENFARSLKKI